MVSADGRQVTVAARNEDIFLGKAQFYSSGKGDRPPMGGVEGVCCKERTWNPCRTANARNKDEVFHLQAQLLNRPQDGLRDDAIAATRASGRPGHMLPHIFSQRVFRNTH